MLASRMGLEDVFPWKTQEELINYALEPSGMTWDQVVASGRMPNLYRGQAEFQEERKYLKTGFATPSGKVELYSKTLEDLGFDPLPYYREAAEPTAELPLRMFIGLPDDENIDGIKKYTGPNIIFLELLNYSIESIHSESIKINLIFV